MSLSGDNTPGQLALTQLVPQYEVVSGTPRDREVIAIEQTNRFVNAYRVGLRDLRSPDLAQAYQQETPRSRVSSADGAARYQTLIDDAAELGVDPAPAEEFARLFLPSSARQNFVTMLGRLGLALKFRADVFTVRQDQVAYRNVSATILIGEQQAQGQVVTTGFINQLLTDIAKPLAVTETNHFVSDFAENDAIDADRKAHQRIFSRFGQYIRDYLDL